MNKETIKRLSQYKQLLENRLEAPTPEKHKDHPETFKRFLKNEIEAVKAKLDAARLGE